MSEPIAAFINHARERGMDHATIRMLLLSAGWKEKEIARALTAQALDVPIPSPPDVGGARETFMHLAAVAALYTFVTYALVLVFSYIDLKLPDVATTAYGVLQPEAERAVIPEAMAGVIVAFPVLIWLSALLTREMHVSPDKARSTVRRWLTYLTLFVAGVTLAIDVITLIASLLMGELSVRFALKVAAVFVVASACFVYYLLSLRLSADEARRTHLHKAFGWGSSVVVVGCMVLGFMVVGSPGAERLRRFDAQRLTDVKTIRDEAFNIAVGMAWRNPAAPVKQTQALPATLQEVRAQSRQRQPRIVDPQTAAPYEYVVTGNSTFHVCAVFAEARDEPADVPWNHPAGHYCFDFDALNPRR